VRRVRPAPAAELLHLQALGRLLLVLGRHVVAALALAARQGNVVSHDVRLPALGSCVLHDFWSR